MSTDKFTHLHVHSEYSLLDGAASIKKLVNQTKKLGMETLALTDHGNMFGAAAFFSTAKKADIKPIIGIEAYIAPGNRRDKDSKGISEASNHLILLAKNNQGYKNLLKLSSIGYTEGFYYRPRIDREVLEMYHEGLICTSACLGGEIPAAIAKGDMEKAREVTEYYARLFGEDFFMEIQWHCDDQNVMTPMLVDMANQVGVPLVATNDVHFLEEGDYQAHAALTCISTGKNIDDEKRMKYPPELFLKSPEQMRAMFPKWQEACDNTQVIANRCDVEIDFKTQHAPVFKTPKGKTADQYLEELCLKGLKKQYGELTQEVKDRLYHELKVISSKDFSSYFLIVWDFVNFARRNNIPANPRGSGVGTLVGYALEISYVDPLKYGLLFERFMDPERNEMPDIDIDICQNGRGRVIEYVQEKYGHVAQIITFGTMKARAVLRDVCRVHAVPLPDADKLAKLVPDNLGITLQDALEQEPRIKEWCDKDPKMQEVIDISLRLEGLTRHSSVHACAVVIADEPLTNFLPLYKASGSDDLITQFDGPLVEKVGLLKMDFLGLRTLSVVDRACQLIKEGKGVEIDSRDIDLTDKATLETFCKGRTKGVFQFESGGMKDLLQSMKPDRLEDLIAANALYRPGPMTLIPDYIARKHGESWSVPHPVMEKVLSETYGIMVYQEQVMQILNGLGGLPLARAYRLIKAIGKKKYDVIAAESAAFIDGCVENGIDKAKGKELFELIQKFAGYGFNKSHSTQYAILAFQTAYLKTHYPTEFMAALLTFEMGTVDKVAEYIDECKAYNISVLPPDVNESSTDFNVIYQERQEEETPGKSKKKKTKG
ncbi:MAG: DNA polymerase III subunit alpha, partial [Phycisphaerae bacterium]|nr:DNA polymerase III subunit alpha [Phycisphaerae bacterium]